MFPIRRNLSLRAVLLLLSTALIASSGFAQALLPNDAEVPLCLADASWLDPLHVPPADIGSVGDSPGVPLDQQTNCGFHQFAWQWLLHLAQPALRAAPTGAAVAPFAEGRVPRRWETLPIYAQTPNECDVLDTISTEPADVLADQIGQAGGNYVLYAQRTAAQAAAGYVNIVFALTHYNRTLCAATDATRFPTGAMELKTAWRQITDAEAPRYITLETEIEGVSATPVRLGLVGFHLMRSTETHPEFVWATFEHVDNLPDCVDPQPAPATGWAFTSDAADACLRGLAARAMHGKDTRGVVDCLDDAAFNAPTLTASGAAYDGTPQNLCRVYPDGVEPTRTENNVRTLINLTSLNEHLTGPLGLLTQLTDGDPLAVLRNYRLIGTIWTEDGVASTDAADLRGSLLLANSTMESYHQGTFVSDGDGAVRKPSSFVPNCFSCHIYDPTRADALTPLSHIWWRVQPAAWSRTFGGDAGEAPPPVSSDGVPVGGESRR